MARTLKTKGPDSSGLVNPERLRQAVEALHEAGARGLTKEQLAAHLGEVSLRTVDRSIDLLEAQGAQIERSRAGRPPVLVFVLKKGPRWDEAMTPHARLALEVALKSIEGPALEVWGDQLEAISRLVDQHLSTRDRRLFDRLKSRAVVRGAVEDVLPFAAEALEQVLIALGGEPGPFELEVDYFPVHSKRNGLRTVIPHALVHDIFSGGAFLLVWDSKEGGPRHLRLSRIHEAKATRKLGTLSSEERARLERAQKYQVGGWFHDEPEQEIQVRIGDAGWIRALEEALPALPECDVRRQKDGSALVSFKATEFSAPTRWILQFGSAAEVLSPPALRAEVKKRLKATLDQY